jgi:Sulfotransferase family
VTIATPLKVLSIMGTTRSGSTILDNVLGSLDGFVSVGEVHYLWERGIIEGRRCGCGARVPECEMWSQVLSEVMKDLDAAAAGPDGIAQLQRLTARVRHTPAMLCGSVDSIRSDSLLSVYARICARLYRAIEQATGAAVIVDSSKRPSDVALNHLLPGIESYVLHLVRDPRAVAFSWLRHKPEFDGSDDEMPRHGALYSSVRWLGLNAVGDIVRLREGGRRTILLRYEDFVARPLEIIENIIDFVDEPVEPTPFIDERTVRLQPSHAVSGNPSRFVNGPVELREDGAWRGRLGRADRLLTTAICLPLLRHYRYPVRTGR